MKKYIAIFTVLTLAFAASAALAGNRAILLDWDDSALVQSSTSLSVFRVNVSNYANLNSNINMVSNTGGNTLVAGDDLDAGSIDSGDADLDYSEISDVNDTDVQYSGCGCDGDEDNDLTGTDVDDSVIVQSDDSQNIEEIASNSVLDENFTANFAANTGGNTAVAGGDMGEDEAVTIDSGDSDASVSRNFVRNFLSIFRN